MLAGLVDLGIEVAGQEVVLQGVVPALDPGFAGAPAPRTKIPPFDHAENNEHVADRRFLMFMDEDAARMPQIGTNHPCQVRLSCRAEAHIERVEAQGSAIGQLYIEILIGELQTVNRGGLPRKLAGLNFDTDWSGTATGSLHPLKSNIRHPFIRALSGYSILP
ncbi:MAG: hypothetical protein K2Q27_10555 [Novosphingobium sp.]|jgi:hypothetical protein|nr:hypothetical protein [Novosphingobium sp.]